MSKQSHSMCSANNALNSRCTVDKSLNHSTHFSTGQLAEAYRVN